MTSATGPTVGPTVADTHTVADTYDERYADRLWSLVPAVYRAGDAETADGRGPLQELLNRVAGQVAEVRRSIDRLWEDESIEACDSWVISYLADLLATNLVPAMDARGQRLDVANTIYYRRRKGTVALLEQLAADVTHYDVRVVEFFRQLSRTRHGLDPAIGSPADTADPGGARRLQRAEGLTGLLTGTPAGGFADLRDPLGADLTDSAYDEYHHRIDVRRGLGDSGWYGISKVGFFLWRTLSLRVDRATPVPVSGCPGHYSFDPTGRQIPLFQASARGANDYGESWLPLAAWQLPMPLTTAMWEAVAAAGAPDPGPQAYPDPDASLWPSSLAVSPTGTADPLPVDHVLVWPEVGRFELRAGAAAVEVGYHYGLFSRIGAGPFDRRQLGTPSPVDPAPVQRIDGGSAVDLVNAIAAMGDQGTIVVDDGLTSTATGPVGSTGSPIVAVAIRGDDQERAVIRTEPAADPWVFQGATAPGQPGSRLRLEALLVSGSDIVLRGRFDEVVISCCTLDPGDGGNLRTPPVVWDRSVDGRDLTPTTVWVEGDVRTLTVDRSITGPIRTRQTGLIEALIASDSVLQGVPTESGSTLSALRDGDGLFSALHHRRDPLSDWLADQLSAASATAVTAHVDGQPVATADADLVIADLQLVIDGALIWTAARFVDRPLRDSTLAAAQSSPTGADLAALNRQLLAEAYPMALADAALATDAGLVELSRCTVLGAAYVHRLECSESILDDVVRVINAQDGCVRFSAWATQSALPRRYESVEIAAGAPVMVSRRYGEWGYAQVHDGADRAILSSNTGGPPSILTGSRDGSEMGVFCRDDAAIKDRSLLIKLQEFLPIGLSSVLLHRPEADPDGEFERGRPWPPT